MDERVIVKLKKSKRLDRYTREALPGREKLQNELSERLNLAAIWEDLFRPDFEYKAGQQLLLCGIPGASGTQFLLNHGTELLQERFCTTYLEEAKEHCRNTWHVETKLFSNPERAVSVLPVFERGLNAALYRLGKESGLGFTVEYRRVPVLQEIIEFCNVLDLNHWSLFSDCLLIVGDDLNLPEKELIRAGIPCGIIGVLTGQKEKQIIHRSRTSSINKPIPDELLPILRRIILKGYVNDKTGRIL